MKLEISDYDLKTIAKLQEYLSYDTSPETYKLYKRSLTLLKNINKQIPDKPPASASRRIRICAAGSVVEKS